MKIQFIKVQAIQGVPVDVNLLHPDIIVGLKGAGWNGTTLHLYYNTLYFTNTRGDIMCCTEKIYRD